MDHHIVIITPGFAKDENDDITIPPIQVFFKAYQKRYPETRFSIISLQYPFKKKTYDWNGIKVYSCGGQNKRGLNKFKTWKQARKYFKEIVKQEKPSLVHSFWLNEAALVGNYLAKKYELKHVVTLMGQDALRSNRYLRILDINYPQLVTLTKYHQQAFKTIYPKKDPAIITWGIDSSEFSKNRYPRKYDILGAGSLIPLKQFDLFIKIIRKIKEEKPEIKVAIAGAGAEKDRILALISASGLIKNIELLGQISRHELLKVMEQSKVFLHTSSYESQGYVLSEALAAGMAVVSTRVGIASEIEEITAADSEDELVDAILKKVLNEQQHLSTVPVTIDQTIDAYHQIYTT